MNAINIMPALTPCVTGVSISHQTIYHTISLSLESVTSVLTRWGRVMHICVSKVTIIGSDYSLAPGRRQAIIWTNDRILLIRTFRTHFSEIVRKIIHFHSRKCISKCRQENGGHLVSASKCLSCFPFTLEFCRHLGSTAPPMSQLLWLCKTSRQQNVDIEMGPTSSTAIILTIKVEAFQVWWCIKVSVNCAIIGLGNALEPVHPQAFTWTND